MHRFAANDIRPVYTLTSLFLACIQVTSSLSQPRLSPNPPPAPPPKKKTNVGFGGRQGSSQ